jgi:hypothetical protein
MAPWVPPLKGQRLLYHIERSGRSWPENEVTRNELALWVKNPKMWSKFTIVQITKLSQNNLGVFVSVKRGISQPLFSHDLKLTIKC